MGKYFSFFELVRSNTAEKNGIITRQDVDLAYKVKEKIIEKYGHNIDELKRYTDKYVDLIR